MGISHRVDMVLWVIKAECVQFWTRARNCSRRRTCVFGCIFVFIEVLWSWYMFVIVMNKLFYGWLFMYVQWSSEGKFLQRSIILYWKLSQTFVDKSTNNIFLFQVLYWWGPGYLKGSVLIMLTSISVLIPLTSVSVLVLLNIVSVLVLLTGCCW